MRRRLGRDFWAKRVAEQERSGLTISEYCRRKNLEPTSFYRWRKKIGTVSSIDTTDGLLSSLVPVSVASATDIVIDLPCGASIRIPLTQSSVDCVVGTLLRVGIELKKNGGVQ